jgi:aryl-alcohol dehydrogenase-like predicted oxidoreductase
MRYRSPGRTGLRISEIGFGTGGTAGLMINGSHEQQLRAVERAIELGINYFDESPDYGDGVSESNLGRILAELGLRPVITTKVEVRNENLDDIAGHVERSVDASLKRLGVDYVDFVQIHNGPVATKPDLQGRAYNILWIEDYLRPGGAIDGLQRIVRDGKTRFVGFICRGNDGPQVRQLIDTGVFHLINLVYTLINPSAGMAVPRGLHIDADFGDVIGYAHSKGVGTADYSPLAGGLLTDHMVSGGEPHPLSGTARRGPGDRRRSQVSRGAAFQFLSIPGQHTLAQAATRFILMNPGISTVLGGFSDVAQMEEAVAAVDVDPLSEELMARIEMVWRANLGQAAVEPPAPNI